MKKYLQDVENPEDITGLSKKYHVTFSGYGSIHYSRTIKVIAQDEEDAEDIAQSVFDEDEFREDDENDKSFDHQYENNVVLDESDK